MSNSQEIKKPKIKTIEVEKEIKKIKKIFNTIILQSKYFNKIWVYKLISQPYRTESYNKSKSINLKDLGYNFLFVKMYLRYTPVTSDIKIYHRRYFGVSRILAYQNIFRLFFNNLIMSRIKGSFLLNPNYSNINTINKYSFSANIRNNNIFFYSHRENKLFFKIVYNSIEDKLDFKMIRAKGSTNYDVLQNLKLLTDYLVKILITSNSY